MWAYANQIIMWNTWSDNPYWFVGLFLILTAWESMHFYFVHRLIHWPPLYKTPCTIKMHRRPVVGVGDAPGRAPVLFQYRAHSSGHSLPPDPYVLPYLPDCPVSLYRARRFASRACSRKHVPSTPSPYRTGYAWDNGSHQQSTESATSEYEFIKILYQYCSIHFIKIGFFSGFGDQLIMGSQ